MNTPPLPNLTSEQVEKLSNNTMTDAEIAERRKQLEHTIQGFHESPIAYKTTSPKEFGQTKLNRKRK